MKKHYIVAKWQREYLLYWVIFNQTTLIISKPINDDENIIFSFISVKIKQHLKIKICIYFLIFSSL